MELMLENILDHDLLTSDHTRHRNQIDQLLFNLPNRQMTDKETQIKHPRLHEQVEKAVGN